MFRPYRTNFCLDLEDLTVGDPEVCIHCQQPAGRRRGGRLDRIARTVPRVGAGWLPGRRRPQDLPAWVCAATGVPAAAVQPLGRSAVRAGGCSAQRRGTVERRSTGGRRPPMAVPERSSTLRIYGWRLGRRPAVPAAGGAVGTPSARGRSRPPATSRSPVAVFRGVGAERRHWSSPAPPTVRRGGACGAGGDSEDGRRAARARSLAWWGCREATFFGSQQKLVTDHTEALSWPSILL
jgi:hypothetical protein